MEIPSLHPKTYIIGSNGSGKSRALEENAQKVAMSRPVVVLSTVVADKFTYGAKKKPRGKGSYTYLGNRTVGNASHINTLSANLVLYAAKVFGNESDAMVLKEILNQFGFESKIGVTYRATKGLKKQPAFEDRIVSAELLREFSDIFQNKSKPFEALFYKSQKPFKLSELSSGEQTILGVSLKILAHIEDDTCFYIDEPEVSLHTEWQIRWPEVLHMLLKSRPEAKVVIATHSPVIIASALKLDDACYILDDNRLEKISEIEFNVERLIFNEFNTLTPDNKHIYTRFAEIINGITAQFNRGEASLQQAAKEVKKLKNQFENLSMTESDRVEAGRAVEDFEAALIELIGKKFL